MEFFKELEQTISQFLRTRIAKAILLRKMELEKSTFLTSDYTTKLQSSRQYGIGTKTNYIDQWHKINIQKSGIFLYTNNEKSE